MAQELLDRCAMISSGLNEQLGRATALTFPLNSSNFIGKKSERTKLTSQDFFETSGMNARLTSLREIKSR
jgi:hypothetical protein